jgi:hypothetical protein
MPSGARSFGDGTDPKTNQSHRPTNKQINMLAGYVTACRYVVELVVVMPAAIMATKPAKKSEPLTPSDMLGMNWPIKWSA